MRRLRYVLPAVAFILLCIIALPRIAVTGQPAARQNGVSYAAWWPGLYAAPDSDLSLQQLAETGATWISLVVTGYQDNIASTTIYTSTATPVDDDLIHVITYAHSLHLKVMLKPHVDLANDPAHWHGQIGEAFSSETQWAAWYASYRTFIEHYAGLAERYGADQFCVGTELSGTSPRAQDWRSMIAGVRAIYHGPLTYASNHSGDETSITWWDAVDYIGVDAYYPLATTDNPTLDELLAAWRPISATLATLSATWGKQIIFTEIGYRSQDGACRHPWDWQSGGAIDLQEQADCYQAMFQSIYDRPWFGGAFWWSWDTDPFAGGLCDVNYTPHDKPAEDVLRQWYGAAPRSATPPPLPDESQVMSIYSDSLAPGWQDWSWSAARNLAAGDQVYSGTYAISTTLSAWGALSLWHQAFDTTPYYWLEFYIKGPSSTHLSAYAQLPDNQGLRNRPVDDCRYIAGGTIEPGRWKRVRIPLRDLGADAQTISRVTIQDSTGSGGAFWIDELRLIAARWGTFLPLILLNE